MDRQFNYIRDYLIKKSLKSSRQTKVIGKDQNISYLLATQRYL